jgi:tetratricopeptide (TPR) repeat protein
LRFRYLSPKEDANTVSILQTNLNILYFIMIDTGRVPLSQAELALYRQGLSCAASGDLQIAIDCYARLLDLRSDFWEAWYERGTALEDLGRFAEAIQNYDRALSLYPKREALANLWLRRGNAFQYGLGEYDAALACYDRVLQLQPDQAKAWHNRGNALLYGYRQPETAIASYQRAIELDSQFSLSWRNQGNALVELQRYSEAIACYDQALRFSPNDEIAAQARHQAQQELGLEIQPSTTYPVWDDPLEMDADPWAENRSQGSPDRHPERHINPEQPGLDSRDCLLNPSVAPAQTRSPQGDPANHNALRQWNPPVQPAGGASLVIEDEEGFHLVDLSDRAYTLGRDPQNDICLRSQFVSRFHAVVRQQISADGRRVFQIQDGSIEGKPSTNGVVINGKPVQQAVLNHQDLIVFGPRVQAIFREN